MTGCEGDVSGVTGDMGPVTGDMTGCEGDMTGVTGDMTAMSGDMTGVEGQPPADMMAPEGDQGMGAMDSAFDDGGQQAPPPTDDPMGATMDHADAQNVADGAEGGQGPGPDDPMTDMPDPGMDPGTDQAPDDDQGGGIG